MVLNYKIKIISNINNEIIIELLLSFYTAFLSTGIGVIVQIY